MARGAPRDVRRRALLLGGLLLAAVVAALVVGVGSMALFVREIGATVNACEEVEEPVPAAAVDYDAGPDAPGPGTPPRNFIPAYFAAANQPDAQLGMELGPYVLMGIHEVESGFGRSDAAGVKSGINFANCCKGPFQFYDKPGEWSTWTASSGISGNQFGRDGDGDGDVDIYSNHDAMFAAAAYLHHSGAPGDWSAAILSYNHSTAYRDQVLERAAFFQRTVKPPSGGSPAQPAAPPAVDAGEAEGGDSAEIQRLANAAGCDTGAAQVVAPAAAGPYQEPLAARTYQITTKFWTWRPDDKGGGYNHGGTDFGAPSGTPIHAMGDGLVSVAGEVGGYGLFTCVDHTQRLASCYAHQSRIDVEVGETVRRGQVIGLVGSTGESTGPHLHLEMRIDGAAQCPANYAGIDPARWCEAGSPGFGAQPS